MESRHFQRVIVAVILVNAVTLGLETVPSVLDRHGAVLHTVDRLALGVFVAELAAKIYVQRVRFVREPWNLRCPEWPRSPCCSAWCSTSRR